MVRTTSSTTCSSAFDAGNHHSPSLRPRSRLACAALLSVSLLLGGCPVDDLDPDGGTISAQNPDTNGGADAGSGSGSGSGGGQDNNDQLSLSGKPDTAALIDEPYEFQPRVNAGDAENLEFLSENIPGWANFDAESGVLTGFPADVDVGLYRDIRVGVRGGSETVWLPAFDIEVLTAGPAAITLNWLPPTGNEDGSIASDIAGYIIYYGRETGEYTKSVTIEGGGITSAIVDGLLPKSYYVVATAYNTSGLESNFSGELLTIAN